MGITDEQKLFENRCRMIVLAAREAANEVDFNSIDEIDWGKMILLEETLKVFLEYDLPRFHEELFHAKEAKQQERTKQ